MSFEEKLKEKGYLLQNIKRDRPFEDAVVTGDLVFVSGHAAKTNGELIYKGIVGDTVSIEEAKECAKVAFINCLNALQNTIGSIDNIKRIVNVKGYVASTPDFFDQPQVINEISILINEVFAEKGKHSRASVGVASLPEGTPVEVEIIVEI
ncbi:RidA family protein [Oceanobacillus sp. CAU 1775]